MSEPAALRIESLDGAEIRWDFEDGDGSNNPLGVKTYVSSLDLGPEEPEQTLFPLQHDGDEDVDYRLPSKVLELEMTVEAPSGVEAELRRAIAELGRILQRGGKADGSRLRYQAQAEDPPLYFDFLRSPRPELFEGQPNQFTITEDGIAIDVPVRIRRQPIAYGEELDSATNLIPSNPSLLLEDATNANRPADWDWDDATGISAESIDQDGYHFTIADADATTLAGPTYNAGASIAGQEFTASIFAWSNAADAKARVVITWKNSSGTDISTTEGTLETLPTEQPDLSDPTQALVLTAIAPANAQRAQVKLRVDNDNATARALHTFLAQLEAGGEATLWVPGALTVKQDPAQEGARAYGLYVHGETDAPVRLRMTNLVTTVRGFQVGRVGALPGQLFKVLNRKTFKQGEAADQLLNGATTAAVTGFSGSGNNALRFPSGASAGYAARGRYDFASLPAGTYVLIVRAQATSGAFRIAASLSFDTGSAFINAPALAWTGVSAAIELVLATFTIPELHPDIASRATASIWLFMARDSGSANFDVDYVWLVPAVTDPLAMVFQLNGVNIGSDQKVLTDPEEYRAVLTSGGAQGYEAGFRGPVPVRCIPGTNGLLVHKFVNLAGEDLSTIAQGAQVNIADDLTMSVAYRPRYLA